MSTRTERDTLLSILTLARPRVAMFWGFATYIGLAALAGVLFAVLGADFGPLAAGFGAVMAVVLAFAIVATVVVLWESPIAVVGFLLVAFWVMLATLAPVLDLASPTAPIYSLTDQLKNAAAGKNVWFFAESKSQTHWLGADHKGRDILSRLIWGAQRVLIWATLATMVAYIVGMFFGVVAGYLGGWWDEVISFVANLMLSFPVMVLYIVIINTLGASGLNVIIAVTFASSPGIMRIVRGLVLDLKTRDYIAAAQTRGEHPLYVMIVELLPNARGPLIVDGCLRLGYTTIAIATLGFLGLGLPPPDPDWGSMLAESKSMGQTFPHMMIIPAVALSSLILGFNLMADGLREIALRD